MTTFTVTVKISLLEYYEVEATTPEEALENWPDGRFLGSDDAYLDANPLKTEEDKAAPTARVS